MFVRENAIFNTWGAISHEGRIDGLASKWHLELKSSSFYRSRMFISQHSLESLEEVKVDIYCCINKV